MQKIRKTHICLIIKTLVHFYMCSVYVLIHTYFDMCMFVYVYMCVSMFVCHRTILA